MPSKFGEIAFTPAVKAVQERMGSRETYDRYIAKGAANDTITPEIAEFIASMDGAYLGTTGSNGYPYIQFRGGQKGFLKVLDPKTIGFADYRGNVQYVSVGNMDDNDKAFLFLMDYRHRRRLKLWGRAYYTEADKSLISQVIDSDYSAVVERAIIFKIEAYSWNCPQHIPIRYSQAEVEAMQTRITELENLLSEAKKK
ncbi:pyridoxamine 5'-phosphate oxidase-related, FMN binding protein [Synechococcus sp. PCC 7502]|uniref:pyridoxamine 5'-phosphate oxidase family protein n=1 Tax=Synechococcus sp. PCC 7502 TaxID=1173263 RepID=UPI00029FF267|nr:pyridoxamine 5'-phosphate oxidase family protein [Synechococcus sp. PCC 7502]AFY73424.1 pyridoxamine 5'-phosphate oxidase-related, FMN binding protein [Synechococcus sp. PCC 7502]